ncbi:FecR family protein [Xanthomonas axonopodis pv. poinsettiicola]|uniref:FecR family protein n=1 Tax=Xanthomonas TaxID=338 RepID=UPI001E3D094A|nr:FecR domain-containing protein [Xanthomonas codiaei]MCC8536014.1 FecR domain-containing protein [Xanthomonas codiaei]
MSRPTASQAGSGALSGDAADWVARTLAGNGVDPPGLQHWLAADPAHRAEFDALWALAHDAALLQALAGFQTPAYAPTPAPRTPAAAPASAPARPGRRRWATLAVAASLVLVAVVAWPWLRPAPAPLQVATAPGQLRVLTLDDGSVLTLNGASRVRVQLQAHRRTVALEAGEVFFDVAHDAQRPFEVEMGPARVRVLGTVFNLARDGATSELSVYSGRVEIAEGSARKVLAAGMRTAAGQGGLVALDRFDPAAGDWRTGWLQTSGIALSQLVERLNRRSSQAILITDPAVGALQVSGRFRLDRPQQTLGHLAQLYELQIRRHGDAVTLTRAEAPAR